MALKRRVEPKPQSPLAARILTQREPGRAEVSLERLEAEFAEASRYEIVASLKELEKAGSGQFFVGRKGQRSRFVWARERGPDPARSGKKTARVAKSRADGEAPAPKRPLGSRARRPAAPQPETPAAEPVGGAAARTLRHAFHLRPGLLVSIELPEDVTATEVARFCSFLEAIPFAGSPRR